MANYSEPLNQDVNSIKTAADYVGNKWTATVAQAQKDIAMRAYENIIDTIGAENIKCLLPCWETSGTVLQDLLQPGNVRFGAIGVTLNQPGLLHQVPSFNGTSTAVIEKAVAENQTAQTSLNITTGTHQASQKVEAVALSVGKIRLQLARVGSLASATVQIEIKTDNAGVPGTLVTNGTSEAVPCSAIQTSVNYVGFGFTTPPNLQKNQQYWVCFKYATATGVDASNYILWRYDSAGTYGQPRAYFDGTTWTATAGQSMAFQLYNDALKLPDDFTVIVGCKPSSWAVGSYKFVFWGGFTPAFASKYLGIMYHPEGKLRMSGSDGTQRPADSYRFPQDNNKVYAVSFNKTNSIAKVKAYIDGILSGTADGAANTAHELSCTPMALGAGASQIGDLNNAFIGQIGPLIYCNGELTATQIGKVTNQLRAWQRAQGGI